MQEVLNDSGDYYYGNDLSFLTSLRMRQEQKNLDNYLRSLEKQKRRSLEMYTYQREQTELDLEERVKLKSSYLSELLNTNGKKESIAISRRESLNVLRAHNGRTWNMATGTYHVKTRRHDKNENKQCENSYHQKFHWKARNDTICKSDKETWIVEPKSRLHKPRSRFPMLRRENTDYVVRKREPMSSGFDVLSSFVF